MTSAGALALTPVPVTVPLTEQSSVSAGLNYTIPNTITITANGIYRTNIDVVGSYTVDALVSVILAINGVPQSDSYLAVEMVGVPTATFSLTNYYALSAGDQLTIQMSASAAGTFFFALVSQAAVLAVERVA